MEFGGFVKTIKGENNRMLLSNSHRQVLANFNILVKELTPILEKATPTALLKDEPVVSYRNRLKRLVNKTDDAIKTASNSDLKNNGLFKLNKEFVNSFNEMYDKNTQLLFVVMGRVFGSDSLAKSKYNAFVNIVEKNYDLIDKGDTEGSSLGSALKGALDKPFKASVKAIGMGLAMGTPLGILAPFVSGFANKAIDTYNENRSAAGLGEGALSGWGSAGGGSFNKSSGGSTGGGSSSSSSAGGGTAASNKGRDMLSKSTTLGLFEFFNKDAFQTEYLKTLMDKLGGKGNNGMSNLFGLLSKFIGAVTPFLPVLAGVAGIGIAAFQGMSAMGTSAKENWFGNKPGQKQGFGQNFSAFMGGAIGGGKGIGEKGATIWNVLLNGLVGSLKGALIGFMAGGPFGALAGAFTGLLTAMIGGRRIAIAIKSVGDVLTSAFNGLVGMFKGVIEFFKNPLAALKNGFAGFGSKSDKGSQLGDIAKSGLSDIANTDVAKTEANNESIKAMTDKFSESIDKLSKNNNSSSSTKSGGRSLAKNTGNPHMDYINMGLMGAPG